MRNAPASIIAGVLVAAATSCVYAHGPHSLAVQVSGSELVFHVTEDDGSLTPTRVIDQDFGTSLGGIETPNLTNLPGLEADAGTLPTGYKLSFNLLGPVQFWNGSGFEPTGGETIEVSFLVGVDTLIAETAAAGPVAGFAFPPLANGGLHHHLNYFLKPDALNNRDDGIYLTPIEFHLLDGTSATVASTGTLYIVASQNRADIHDSVIDYVQTNLVPEPGIGLVAAAGMVLLSGRRKRA